MLYFFLTEIYIPLPLLELKGMCHHTRPFFPLYFSSVHVKGLADLVISYILRHSLFMLLRLAPNSQTSCFNMPNV